MEERKTEPVEAFFYPKGSDPMVLVVMGVSGCGKTTIARLLAERLGWTYVDGDWLHPAANIEKMKRGDPLTDEDRAPWLAAIAARVEEIRREGGSSVVACSALKKRYRDVLRGDRGDVRFVFLQGGRHTIARRLAKRDGHFMPPTLLDSQFSALEEPAADEKALVVAIDASPEAIVESVATSLSPTSPS
jgi:carbohydrate kinase (thermoresistant glucokinase family)